MGNGAWGMGQLKTGKKREKYAKDYTLRRCNRFVKKLFPNASNVENGKSIDRKKSMARLTIEPITLYIHSLAQCLLEEIPSSLRSKNK